MTGSTDDQRSAPGPRFATWQDHVEHVRGLAESLGLIFEPRPQQPYGWHLRPIKSGAGLFPKTLGRLRPNLRMP